MGSYCLPPLRTMKLYCSLFLLTLLLVGGDGQVMQACSADKSDCSCKDITYSICHTPPASQELHVGSLEECIQNCDLFGSFGQCNYLLYWSSGPDENCKLIADTTIDQYLTACGVVGQPLRDAYGSCMASAASGSCSLFNCGTECHMCDSNDLCGLYTKTECEKLGSPGETSVNIPNFQTCLSLCTGQQQSNPFTYVTYDQESQECICYPDGLNQCTITAVPYGNTDYAAGVDAAFTDDTSLSDCFQFGLSSKVTEFKVTWTGSGTWTPEKFALERRFGEDWPYCCNNTEGLTLSDGQEQIFTCEETGSD